MKLFLLCAVLCSLCVRVYSECRDSHGQLRHDGDGPYIGEDHCNSCTCMRDESVCTRMFCAPGHSRCMGPKGRIYNEGDSFPSADGCNTCYCAQKGSIICTELACITARQTTGCTGPDGRTYSVGDSFPSADGCNRCHCQQDGAVSCTERACLNTPAP